MPSADHVPPAAPHQLPFYTPHASRMDGASLNSIGPRDEEKGSLDFTQRIERKLAEYNASQSIFKRWLFEVLSWCVSATSMAAVVGIYVHLKDQPISSSRSAVLLMMANVLGKVASAALIVPTTEALGQLKWNWFHKSNAMWDFEIFDKATRGPWGAAMLLFRTKGRSLAALGALLIVLLLAIDTFFQQVVDLPERWSLESAVSKLPVTVHYDPGTTDQYRDWIPSATSDPDLFHVVEKFSYGNGTQPVPFGNGTRPDIPLSCPTSKCTWPVYETLGICSECADVSEHLSYACVSSRIDWTANSTGGFTSEGFFPNATVCGYFLNATEASPILMSGHVVDANATRRGEALIMRSLPLTSLLTKEPLYGNGSINFKEMRNTIVDIVIVSASQGTAETVYRKVPRIAQECVLSWCVKTIDSSYEFGVYEERVIETHLETTPGAFPWIGYPFVDELGGGTDIFFLQDINIAGITSDRRTFSGYGTENSTAFFAIATIESVLHPRPEPVLTLPRASNISGPALDSIERCPRPEPAATCWRASSDVVSSTWTERPRPVRPEPAFTRWRAFRGSESSSSAERLRPRPEPEVTRCRASSDVASNMIWATFHKLSGIQSFAKRFCQCLWHCRSDTMREGQDAIRTRWLAAVRVLVELKKDTTEKLLVETVWSGCNMMRLKRARAGHLSKESDSEHRPAAKHRTTYSFPPHVHRLFSPRRTPRPDNRSKATYTSHTA
ncbi:hypothetical protein HBI70_065670 [Parastagonospora nodorum]|nr:hypothetical protein HBH49_067240 [Parastagonospora nodorum]KAH4212573.1 hypothetical protein HBI95_039140 [Parastagonospora nodorum]KAH4610707.1 hypothetical protein HBH82_048340 [Parastagonospora nodorum]KAH4683563.1 hypothetical protein HBH78_124690 [Parastagonospora nodorum]KAH4712419.1 hypothetical protein HBH67_016290 [Parastagonospora nodorum]